MLTLERCYPDDRDDPRSGEATYPWNHSLVAPWDSTDQPQSVSAAQIGSSTAASNSDIAALACISVLQAWGTQHFPYLIDPVEEYMTAKGFGVSGSRSAINMDAFVLTECRLSESATIDQVVEKLVYEDRNGQLPPIPLGGASGDPKVQADWEAFNKWIHDEGPRPNLDAASMSAAQTHLPDRVGACVSTVIRSIGTRLENTPGSGSALTFANGGYQVSYDNIAAVEKSRAGDQTTMCLVSIPKGCPPGDDRGREYKVTNLRTGQSWTLPDSEHQCGGA